MGKKLPLAPSVQKDHFEVQKMKKQIAELEKQLKDAELKAMAFSMMVDIAEKEFKIPIRKNIDTKP
jgi:transposase